MLRRVLSGESMAHKHKIPGSFSIFPFMFHSKSESALLLPLLLLLAAVTGKAHSEAQPVAPRIGAWDYSSERCDTRHLGFDDELSAIIFDMNMHYSACNDPSIDSVGPWGTPDAKINGACGSTKLYPKFRMGVEYINVRKYTIAYCQGGCGGICRDGLTLYRERSVDCPTGYQWDSALRSCVLAGVSPAKNLGTCPLGFPYAGNPVHMGTGNKFELQRDFSLNQDSQLIHFSRYYNSSSETQDGSLGLRWRHTFDRTIQMRQNPSVVTADVVRPDGKIESFSLINNLWEADSDITPSLPD